MQLFIFLRFIFKLFFFNSLFCNLTILVYTVWINSINPVKHLVNNVADLNITLTIFDISILKRQYHHGNNLIYEVKASKFVC